MNHQLICNCSHVIQWQIDPPINIDMVGSKQAVGTREQTVKCFACGREICVTIQITAIEPSPGRA